MCPYICALMSVPLYLCPYICAHICAHICALTSVPLCLCPYICAFISVPLITGDKQHGYADPVSGRRRCGRGHGQGSYHPGLEKKIEKNGKKTWKPGKKTRRLLSRFEGQCNHRPLLLISRSLLPEKQGSLNWYAYLRYARGR